MTALRVLNDNGMAAFRQFLAAARLGSVASPPIEILTDGIFSEPFSQDIEIEPRTFANAFDLGRYLSDVLSPCEPREISRNNALWSWLALLFIDSIAKPDESGHRKVLEDAVYILDGEFSFRRYYRHVVRGPWQSVRMYGEESKILLLTSGKGTRTDIAEQIGAYADLFGCQNVISAAYQMWFDTDAQRPRRGAGGKGPGSPRRFSTVMRQLQLTYDLSDCPLPEFLGLLPSEFRKWLTP